MTRRLFMIACTMLVLVACGSSNSPVAPPTANITATGEWHWFCLGSSCRFDARFRNGGVGCAKNVRGVTRFYGAAGQQLGSVFTWALGANQVVRPNEDLPYYGYGVSPDIRDSMRTYSTEASWTDVGC